MNNQHIRLSIIGLILTAPVCNILAQAIEKKTYQTAFAQIPPDIDGIADDSCWNLVGWEGDFIQTQPDENKAPSQPTAFKIMYDNNNLYLFVRAFDSNPEKISRRISRRDFFDGDRIQIDIDSYYDKQTAFSFTAMASGAKGDQAITQNGNNWDDSWNPVWYLKTTIDREGWCAEIKIPLSQLRFGRKEEHIWGLQITRHIFRLEERSTWQFIPKGSPGIVHLFGELHGIMNIRPKRQIELMPYAVGKMERFEKEPGNPFLSGKSSSISGGLDGKIALTNDFMLDFSINPDFGQVEADPSEVNLSAFETYYSERRPLFIEGKNIYEFEPSSTIVISDFEGDNLFYSRRIGRYPQYYPVVSETEHVDMPEASTIIGAMKLSGKTKNGLSVGILESVTSNENAIIENRGIRRKESVEPMTNYFTGRIQKDYHKGETTLGGIFTAVNRDIKNPALNYLNTAAYAGGINFYHSWKERIWYVSANSEFSYVAGKPEAMIYTQQSSARYFQRPDARYVSVDSTRKSLAGAGGTIRFGRSSDKKLQFETSITVRSPGLEFNDIGYMRYSDIIHHGTWAGYNMRNPFFIFRYYYINLNYWMYWDFSGKLLSVLTNTNHHFQFKNKWRTDLQLTRMGHNTSNTLLRGRPSISLPGNTEFSINISTDKARKISLFAGNYHGISDLDLWKIHEYWMGFNVRPGNAISLSFEPSYSIKGDNLQYVETTSMNNDPRYIFARLDQKTLSFTLRLNYTINPELTIEYYGQPFISAGKYTRFNRITNPEAGKLKDKYQLFSPEETTYNISDNAWLFDENRDGRIDYTLDKPDYNFRQFRSNLVIRWEYLPGSTLYLVWSQGRTNSASDGSFSYGNDMRELFSLTPHNIFLLKFSYWFSL